ncbi:5285_t:CDS:2, partial [Funneliformis mosseae]
KRKCVDYNDKCALPTDNVEDLESPSGGKQKTKTNDEDSLQGSSSRAFTRNMPHNGENEASSGLVQTRKKKKLSLGKKGSNKDNKEKEPDVEKSEETPKYGGAQEMNMVVITDPTPTNVNIKNGAEDDDLFDDGELSDPSAKSDDDSDDDKFVFDVSDDESDYEESSKSKSKKKSPNTGRKTKSTSAKESGGKGIGKKQTNTSEPSNKKTVSSLLTKKTIGGLKKKAIGESIPSTPKFTSGALSKIPSSGLSRKLKVKPLHPYFKKQ